MTLKKRSPYLQGFEVTIITFIIAFGGYYIDAKDPLLLHYSFSFLILWLAIVTLFYGLTMGLVMWTGFGIFASFVYMGDSLLTSVLLENLFFVFFFGLFFTNLHREIDKQTIKTKYLQLRLKELTNAFFTLKISHDKLESIYITQPASFRFVIADILESCEHNTPELSAKNTLMVLKKFFAVNSATIMRVKKSSLQQTFYTIGDIDTPNKKDPMIEDALTYRKAVYLKDIEEKEQSAYLFVVPFLDKQEEIVAILIIKDIPFMFYHEDTLLKIHVVFNYVWTEYKKRASLDKIRLNKKELITMDNNSYERQDIVDFKLEVARLNNILNDFNIDSRIYSLYTTNSSLNREIDDYLSQNPLFEILDQHISIQCGDKYIHFVLFPFISASGNYQNSKNLDKAIDDIEDKSRVEIMKEELEMHLSPKSFKKLRKKHVSVKNFNHLLKEYGCV
ncbi:Extracellular Matrix protein PelD [hydrothermal vent metagenome]|uniref:Extracellular Matrix protein PelD n=1 Tax=hydrothermal vent metagenome TaxID=652676 RepID=A0A1W1B9M5_9ZZZZ